MYGVTAEQAAANKLADEIVAKETPAGDRAAAVLELRKFREKVQKKAEFRIVSHMGAWEANRILGYTDAEGKAIPRVKLVYRQRVQTRGWGVGAVEVGR